MIEVEQRFDMTPFEVSDDSDASSPGTPIAPEAGATQVKGPVVIEGQTQSTASFRPNRDDREDGGPDSLHDRSVGRAPEGLDPRDPTPQPGASGPGSSAAARARVGAGIVPDAPRQPGAPTTQVVLPLWPVPVEPTAWVVVGAVVLAAALVVTAGVLAWPDSGPGAGGPRRRPTPGPQARPPRSRASP